MTTDAHGVTLDLNSDQTFEQGCQIQVNASDINNIIVTKSGSVTATKCMLYNSAQSAQGAKGTLIEEVTFSGNTATFTAATTLSANTYYYINVDKDGASYTIRVGSATTPITGTNIDWIGDYWDGAGRDDLLGAITQVVSSTAGTKFQINIGDTWKAVPAMKINIGDVWKNVASAKINIGDVWKTI